MRSLAWLCWGLSIAAATSCRAEPAGSPAGRPWRRGPALVARHPGPVGSDALATLNGETVTVADIVAYADTAREPGYRPATIREARRLLQVYSGIALLAQEAMAEQAGGEPG